MSKVNTRELKLAASRRELENQRPRKGEVDNEQKLEKQSARTSQVRVFEESELPAGKRETFSNFYPGQVIRSLRRQQQTRPKISSRLPTTFQRAEFSMAKRFGNRGENCSCTTKLGIFRMFNAFEAAVVSFNALGQ